MRFLCGLLILSLNVFAASPVIFGARGGASINNDTNTVAGIASGASLPKTYVVGPSVGVRLPLGFSVEGDALYNRQNLNFGEFAGFSGSTHSDAWEFPVMLKYTAGHGIIAPVFGAGVSVRHINNFGSIPSYLFNATTDSNAVGFVAGAGFQFNAGPAHITPEFRYTHWNGNSLTQTIANTFIPGQHAATVLVGITF